ncbi:MAG: EI24 domain-containing protein [Bdellovibrionales bacterium]
MKKLPTIFWLSILDILKPRILTLLFVPFFGSFAVWGLITFLLWDWITNLGLAMYNLVWMQKLVEVLSPLVQFTENPLIAVVVTVFIVFIIFPAALITALFITSVVLVPALVSELRKKDFPTLVKKSTSIYTGTSVSLAYSVKYFASWVGSLPFWLIPGGAIIVPFLLIAWFNSRLLAWEVLTEVASKDEINEFINYDSKKLFTLGLMTAPLYYIPIINIIAPVITSSFFARYCLTHLQDFRNYKSHKN